MIQKSYSASVYGKLYLVPTPIGNLGDITIRSIKVLSEVDKIYAEDTRETMLLLSSNKIKKRVESCHKYSEERNKQKIIDELMIGKNIAYVSDRGTPLISDPGSVIVEFAVKNNIDVISLPGPSALLPALNMSNLNNEKFIFYGFLNNKKTIRLEELKKLTSLDFTIIFYEAPHRYEDTLNDMYLVFGDRKVSVIREISKLHEEVYRGTLGNAIKNYINIKGEIVIVVEGNKEKEEVDYIKKVKDLIDSGIKFSDAVKEVATVFGISKNALYSDCKERFL